jgi:RHS repeat-associated protein
VGNRVTAADETAQRQRLSYKPASNQLLTVTEAPGTTAYDYDAAGNPTAIGGKTYVYGVTGRLMQAKKSADTIARYAYNAQGERIAKTVYRPDGAPSSTYFLYHAHRLDAEIDDGGNVVAQYIYFGHVPIAKLEYTPQQANGVNAKYHNDGSLLAVLKRWLTPAQDSRASRIYAIHTDHLGTPRLATDTQQRVVWQASYTAYGQASVIIDTMTLNLRFPGQYYDKETNLHYNGYRDYDPWAGRYVESDPIGMRGGLNTYAYVGGNPISSIDPLGLFDIPAYSQWMNDHAHANSQHQCAKYVRQGLEAGDADTTGHPRDAKNYGPTLINNEFTPIPSDNYTPQAGDTVVFQPYPGGNPSGHIEMFNGDRWVSDFNQNLFLPSAGYRNSTYQIYRAPSQ